MAPTTIRVGAASPSTQASTAETLALLELVARRAAAQKVDILLLPEAFIGGYPRGTAFGCVIGNRSAEGRDEYLRYFQSAVDLGDTVGDGAGAGDAWVRRELEPDLTAQQRADEKSGLRQRGDGTREELERIARETGVFTVTGCIEKAGGSMYCSVVYVCPKLGVIGKRRKVMPTGTERLVWAQGSPATLRAVSTVIRGVRVNLAAAICWENYMPLLRQSLYAQNINLYLAPTADGRDAWLSLMRTVAIEGRCYVVSSNMCVRDGSREQEPAPFTNGHDHQSQQQRERRSSCVTKEGFEIALPSPVPSPPAQARSRRRSVFDPDGNEIVLPGREAVPEDAVSPTTTNEVQKAVRGKERAKSGRFISRGGSSIVSPFGDVVAGPQWEDDEGLIYADVDLEDCIRGRLDLDNAGSYSRNDSFKLSVEGLSLDPLPY